MMILQIFHSEKKNILAKKIFLKKLGNNGGEEKDDDGDGSKGLN